jgi:hypothetical protein
LCAATYWRLDQTTKDRHLLSCKQFANDLKVQLVFHMGGAFSNAHASKYRVGSKGF